MAITKQVKEIRFTVLSPEQIKRLSVAKVVTPELYDMDGYPVDGGLMDLRLGAIGPGIRCRTCGNSHKECLGHFGHIELARPIVHIKFIPLIDLCLRSTCQECSRILINDKDIKLKRIDKAKLSKKCPWCGAKQDKIKLEKPSVFNIGKKRIFPTEIRDKLAKISNEDLKVLGIHADAFRPEWAILTLLLVPPVTARASITLETGERSEDDLTHKLSDILRANQRLWENLNAGAPEVIIEDLWDLLQYHITTYFDNNISQVPPARHRSGQPLKTITERIKGKEGRIRHNLAGKRVNFSSRTVISPDPYLKLNEVGIPLEIAKVLTIPERVTDANIDFLRKLIKKTDYPCATAIEVAGRKKRITDKLREQFAEELAPGYIVERQIREGDVVLFNRHPSLHKLSLMGHFVKVLPGRTFRIHPAVTYPYNADFDGDEMNVHVPQTEEARAEAKVLMDINQNLISPRINSNVFGCVEDSITGLYLLTSTFKIAKSEAVQYLMSANNRELDFSSFKEQVNGKEIVSMILPKIDFECKSKACKGKECPYFNRCKKEDCPNDAYLCIKKGKILSGVIDERSLGIESDTTNTIIIQLDRQFGREVTMETIRKLFLLGVLFLTKHGITISLEDIKSEEKTEREAQEIINKAEKEVDSLISSYEDKSLEILPGKSLEESREIKIIKTLNEIRTKEGEIIKKNLKKSNPAYIMMVCGAKGSVLFLTQMAVAVGQQALWAKRIDIGYNNRTLSFFKEDDLSPRARGFVRSNFLKGLDVDEFFFTAMTGRDSLMDTALRTPKSGYLYRRLANALQDLKSEYDLTVRDSNSNIIQFEYGEDGIDITKEHLEDNKLVPAEAVGITTAQSLGEPATQMTLRTFHYAGVSEMQVTVGLPRLIEIFDARKEPSTPSMEIYLEKDMDNEDDVRKFARKVKEVKLSEVAKQIDIDFVNSKIEISLNKDTLKNLYLNVEKVVESLDKKNIKARIGSEDRLIIKSKESLSYGELYHQKEKLKETIISGVKNIKQVLPVRRDNGDNVILTAGSNFEEIMKLKGVDKTRTITNNIYEITKVLGIEAARQAISLEVKRVIENQGLAIDERHIKIISEAMTNSGGIKGTTRIGIIEEKPSVLARASFETPIKHFINASIAGTHDKLVSVVENLILNQPVPVGTGLPGLLVKLTDQEALVKTKPVKPKKEDKEGKKKKEK
jgi:DNA-directed RNA polymerase subunit A'